MVSTLVTDISDEMDAHEAVRQQSRLLRRVADSLPIGLIVLNEDRTTVFANAGLPAVLGTDATPDLDTVLDLVRADDRPRLAEAVTATLDQQADRIVEVALAAVAGDSRRCLFTLAALTDDEGVRGAVVSITDVTASSRLREDLTARATRDPLTGCRNRASLCADLEHALSSEKAAQTAVLFIDLDRFKAINDTHGHHAGDQLLIAITNLLRDALRTDDVLGRWGGDEFLVICRQVTQQEALAVARRLVATLAEPIRIAGTTIEATGSIGVAIAAPGIAADELIAQADAAMYAAKQSAKHRIAVHHSPTVASGERRHHSGVEHHGAHR
jgi:diguanylate cyclase (GGDEF)-like protein